MEGIKEKKIIESSNRNENKQFLMKSSGQLILGTAEVLIGKLAY